MAIQNRRTRRGAFEISFDNGLISLYALRRRGNRGKPDPRLEALLAGHAQRLKEKQEMAKPVKQRQQLSKQSSQFPEANPPSTGLDSSQRSMRLSMIWFAGPSLGSDQEGLSTNVR